ncbi:MAG: hypothetical protein M3O67_03395 [Bacteroidota bacterium]|nr:hypothetical protein [Bacteroidota bacterium]
MKKFILPFAIILVSSIASFSQTIKQKIDQVKKDPETANKAAKADVLLIDKKNIADTTHQPHDIISQRKKSGYQSKRKIKHKSS